MNHVELIPFPDTSVKSLMSPTITSRELADELGMSHKNMLRLIANYLKTSVRQSDGSTLAPRDYIDSRGKTQKQYVITEVGLLLLAPKLGLQDKVVDLFLTRLEKTTSLNKQLISDKIKLLEEAADPRAVVLLENKYGRSFSRKVPLEMKTVWDIRWDVRKQTYKRVKVLAKDLTPVALWTNLVEKCKADLLGKQEKLVLKERYLKVLQQWESAGSLGEVPTPKDNGIRTEYQYFI